MNTLQKSPFDECSSQKMGTLACFSELPSIIKSMQTENSLQHYYTDRGSRVFVTFADYIKAFDRVNYWKLFIKLIDDVIHPSLVKVFAYWYSNQEVPARWNKYLSRAFYLGNSTGHGGVLSAYFFSCYIRNLLRDLSYRYV